MPELPGSKGVHVPGGYIQGNLGFRMIFSIIFRTMHPTKVLVQGSCPIELEDILKSCTKGNECSLDYGPHPIDIESGPPPEDRVRCRLKSIQLLGPRQKNKGSPPDKKMEFS
ncbi:hypothetical protein Bca101_057710 [Brassica carinata]